MIHDDIKKEALMWKSNVKTLDSKEIVESNDGGVVGEQNALELLFFFQHRSKVVEIVVITLIAVVAKLLLDQISIVIKSSIKFCVSLLYYYKK